MNDINKDRLSLTEIKVPVLGDAAYAENLSKAFETINANFNTLALHGFIKGDSGNSVEIKEVKFFIDGKITVYGTKLIEYIQSRGTSAAQASIYDDDNNEIGIFDYFYSNPGSLQMIYNLGTDVDDPILTVKPISSLYYVFLDGRYAALNSNISKTQYEKITDFSCIVVYDQTMNDGTGGFRSLDHAFPTVYYEHGVGLCWNINGAKTGLPIQGIPGKDGNTSKMHIVQVGDIVHSDVVGQESVGEVVNIYNIDKIYADYDGFVPIDKYEDDKLSLHNQPALIIAPAEDNTNSNKFYFGKLIVSVDEYTNEIYVYAHCSPASSINNGMHTEDVINAMREIDILNNGTDNGSTGIKGLFIPLESRNSDDNSQKVHLITATSITNNSGDNDDLKTDLLITPVKDINNISINVENPNSSRYKTLEVEKYLYLKVKQNSTIFDYVDENDPSTNINGISLKQTNYYLKYKLSKIVSDVNSLYFGKYDPITDKELVGSRYYGNATYVKDANTDGDTVKLSDSNTVVLDQNNNVSSNHYDSMPQKFIDALSSGTGIYRWELCDDVDDFDIDELLSLGKFTAYDFDKKFNAIYTTVNTPSTDTNFMWFNGIEIYENRIENEKYVIPGWRSSSNVFEFVKFVPIYVNSFKIDDDTTLNLNYNVNITGDSNNPNKGLTVHGDINCETLNAYNSITANEIKNIYTKDVITGENGINLGVEDGEYAFTVNSSGDLKADSGEFRDNLVSNEIIGSNGIFDNVISKAVSIKLSDNIDVKIGSSDVHSESIGATLTNVNDINIVSADASDQVSESLSTIPVITSNVPMHNNDNSTITVSNQSNDSTNIYAKNISRSLNNIDGGKGISDNSTVKEASFDSAKNFNMHRLSLDDPEAAGAPKYNKETGSSLNTNGNIATSESTVAWTINYKLPLSASTIQSPEIAAINRDYVLKNYIQQFNIAHSSEAPIFSDKDGIKITFNNAFVFQVGLYGKYASGSWPCLNKDSKLVLELYYAVDSGEPETLGISSTYNFGYSTYNTSNNNGYEWIGFKATGEPLSEYGNRGEQWRYNSFKLMPHNMNIPSNNAKYKDIVNAYNARKNITIYVVPKFTIKAHSQTDMSIRKTLVSGIRVTCPRKYTINDGTIVIGNVMSKLNNSVSVSFNVVNPNNTGKIEYTTLSKSASSVKNTTICDDGVVMRAGDYVFGLGYAKTVVNHNKCNDMDNNGYWITKDVSEENAYLKDIPVLFYHKYDSKYYKDDHTPKNDNGNTIKGYSERINAIPLEDIFKCVSIVRSKYPDEFK